MWLLQVTNDDLLCNYTWYNNNLLYNDFRDVWTPNIKTYIHICIKYDILSTPTLKVFESFGLAPITKSSFGLRLQLLFTNIFAFRLRLHFYFGPHDSLCSFLGNILCLSRYGIIKCVDNRIRHNGSITHT